MTTDNTRSVNQKTPYQIGDIRRQKLLIVSQTLFAVQMVVLVFSVKKGGKNKNKRQL